MHNFEGLKSAYFRTFSRCFIIIVYIFDWLNLTFLLISSHELVSKVSKKVSKILPKNRDVVRFAHIFIFLLIARTRSSFVRSRYAYIRLVSFAGYYDQPDLVNTSPLSPDCTCPL